MSDRQPGAATAPASARASELMELLEAYNQTTQRLERSHALLQQEVSRLTSELSEKNRELARKNRLEALGEMAAGVAHEIRNPLGGIEVTVGLLARRLNGDAATAKLTGRIFEGIATMNRIVEGMLDFTADRPVQRCRCAVADLTRPAIAEVALEAERAGVALDILPVSTPEVYVEADADMMVRVFANLLRNAVQATPRGRRVALASGADAKEKLAWVEVRDTGHGIAEELRERIFNPFFTTRDTGIGLGLAIVHRIVMAHGGTLHAANNAEDPGATFRVTLPRCFDEGS